MNALFIIGFLLLLSQEGIAKKLSKRAAFLIPDGSDLHLKEPLKTSFRCANTGYFADIDNNCQMYHVCLVQRKPTGQFSIRQFSFICANNTIFNQLTLICDDVREALPCDLAPKYYKLNAKLGKEDEWLHTGEDYLYDDVEETDSFDSEASASVIRPRREFYYRK